MADWLEGFVPMKMHVLIRFGRWADIIATPPPEDPDLFCVTTAMIHYAKAVAHAAGGNGSAADDEAYRFDAAVARVPPSRYLFNNTCLDILAIAAEMLKGEIAYRKGRFEAAFAHLRRSVELDDNLPYDEPWGWMQPTRHALGALLLEQGHVEEAESVYRTRETLVGRVDSVAGPSLDTPCEAGLKQLSFAPKSGLSRWCCNSRRRSMTTMDKGVARISWPMLTADPFFWSPMQQR